MKDYYKYVKRWQDASIKMNEAMQKDDFETADKMLKESMKAYETYKKCSAYPNTNKGRSFGELNYMFESELPNLFKHSKKALKECMQLVKSDPNLLSEFKFLDSLRNYNCNGDARDYVTESLDLAMKTVNQKTIKESIDKYGQMLAKHEIGGYTLDEETKRFYHNCEKLMTEKKKITNLSEYTNALNEVAEYVNSHKAPIIESRNSVDTMTEELEKKIANLSEEDQSLVKDIIDFKTPIAEARQEKLFNKFKNECLEKIKSLKETTNNANEINGLNAIKEQLENRVYCKESIVQDIAQMLEVRDVLFEK